MNREIQFEELSRLELALPGQPIALVDQIERFGCAMTAKQLAAVLAISKISIYKYAKAGRLPSFRIGTSVRFCPKTVAEWLRRQ